VSGTQKERKRKKKAPIFGRGDREFSPGKMRGGKMLNRQGGKKKKRNRGREERKTDIPEKPRRREKEFSGLHTPKLRGEKKKPENR